MVLFECKICDYITGLKSNYNRHNNSNKHEKNILSNITYVIHNEVVCKPFEAVCKPFEAVCKPFEAVCKPFEAVFKPSNNYKCEYCDKIYNHRQSLSKHIKYSCKKNKDEDLKELVRLLNLQLEQQRADSDKQLENQQKQIDKLMEKLQVPQVSNTTTNNIQNNNIRLSYNNTDVSHLTDADYRKSVNSLLMCVKTFIGIVHLDPDHPENMNIYISNLKDKYIMVYTGETWELKNRQYEIVNLYDNKEMLLTEWVEEHGNRDLQDKFKRYLESRDNSIQMIHEEIRLMLYNKRHLALCE